jgi:signal transduction histidine kinase
MRLSIQKKAVAAITILMVALAFTLMSISLYHGGRAIRDELLMRGKIATKSLAHNASYATLINDSTVLRDLLDGMMVEKEVLYTRIVDAKGHVLAQRQRAPEDGATYSIPDPTLVTLPSYDVAPPEIHDADEGVVHFHSVIAISEEAPNEGAELGLYDVATPSESGPQPSRRVIGYAQSGMTTRYIEETIDGIYQTMLWTTVLAVLLATLITSIMVRISIRPINELVIATRRVAAGDCDAKVTTPVRKDEVGELAVSFNKMTEDLKASRDALVEKDLLEETVVELKETQQQLVQAGKMAAIGQLAAGVAHEINNPLAGIMGYAQLATEHMRAKQQTGIPPSEIPKFIAYIENMEKQSQRGKQIVQNLLRFARVSSSEEPEAIDINEVLRETLLFLAHQVGSANVHLDQRLADTPLIMKGHAGKLQQIFTNILINAAQAIRGADGRITIETSAEDGWAAIRVMDNGEGIPPENLDKIFEPFFTTKEIGQGTGLGLSVTYGLVKDMGGNIGVQSRVGIGTTFVVTFPQLGPADHRPGPTAVAGRTPADKEAPRNA